MSLNAALIPLKPIRSNSKWISTVEPIRWGSCNLPDCLLGLETQYSNLFSPSDAPKCHLEPLYDGLWPSGSAFRTRFLQSSEGFKPPPVIYGTCCSKTLNWRANRDKCEAWNVDSSLWPRDDVLQRVLTHQIPDYHFQRKLQFPIDILFMNLWVCSCCGGLFWFQPQSYMRDKGSQKSTMLYNALSQTNMTTEEGKKTPPVPGSRSTLSVRNLDIRIWVWVLNSQKRLENPDSHQTIEGLVFASRTN